MQAPNQMKFLIVDDQDNMRRSIRAMLKLINFGREYFEAVNGREAWRLLEHDNLAVDFIISDWNMPHMTGTELLQLIRNSKKFRDIPFLMITAETNQNIVAEAAEYDVDAYLTKPFVTATLEQKINELLYNASHPAPLTVQLNLLRTLQEKGDIDGAIEAGKKASGLNKRSSRPLRELGRLFLLKGDLNKALLCFQKAIELNRLDVASYHQLGQIYFRLNDLEKSVSHFTKAMEISPRQSERAIKFANILLQQKKLQEAEKILRLVLRNNEDDLDLQEDIADTCNEFGLYELAAKSFRTIVANDPTRTHLHKKLGIILYKQGNPKESVDVIEKIMAKGGSDIDLILTLAQAYLDLRMPLRADKWATRAIRIDPTNTLAKEILSKCL